MYCILNCTCKEDVTLSCKNVPEGLSIFKGELSQYYNCLEALRMKINFVPEVLTKTLKLLEAPVAVFMTGPCLFFVDGIRLTPITFVCNCFLSSSNETITQATRMENSNVWKPTYPPRSTDPDNFSSKYSQTKLIVQSWTSELEGVPAPWTVTLFLDAEVSPIHWDKTICFWICIRDSVSP